MTEQDPQGTPEVDSERACLEMRDLSLWYGSEPALNGISMDVQAQRVTAFIGPSGCGKSSLLRCLNRMNALIAGVRPSGSIKFYGAEINHDPIDVSELRRKIGMVFQKPNPFPKSIFDNVAFGLKMQGYRSRVEIEEQVEWALKSAALWEEVKNRLKDPALALSGGQQQRLVIARAIAIKPTVLLLDEPASSLDPISTLKIEELIHQLKNDYTIVIVTHNMQQAARVSDYTAFLHMGEIVEIGATDQIFLNPVHQQTEDYITGRYG